MAKRPSKRDAKTGGLRPAAKAKAAGASGDDTPLLGDGLPAADYRHDTKRKNNPPATIAAEGIVPIIARVKYAYDPHRPPILRFDQTGDADKIETRLSDAAATRAAELLSAAQQRALKPAEAAELSKLLDNAAHADLTAQPWLEWTGKREKKSFEVDPVALHIHERISAQAILRVAARQDVQRSLFADPQQDYHEAVQFYKHEVDWANRLILGDSLQVMSSLARREDLAGKVQMIYMDPPYGIKFASNFQPEVGKRDVKDKQEDLTREPEMVRAYRDTWHLGIHSYLSYLRDRLLVARELLADTGSIFVQISDENLHHVLELLDEVFGGTNRVAVISFKKTTSQTTSLIGSVCDYIIWYSRDRSQVKYGRLYSYKVSGEVGATEYKRVEFSDGQIRSLTDRELEDASALPRDGRVFSTGDITSAENRGEGSAPVDLPGGMRLVCPLNRHWTSGSRGTQRLWQAGRLLPHTGMRIYKRFLRDFSVVELNNLWGDTRGEPDPQYVVQTSTTAIERCMLMTTDPGDLVLDPTCGSGTTAYVAEQWGRRWITTDTSRVAIAIARQRLLTAKFDMYRTKTSADSAGGSPESTIDDPASMTDARASKADAGASTTGPRGTTTIPHATTTVAGVTKTVEGSTKTIQGSTNAVEGAKSVAHRADGAHSAGRGAHPADMAAHQPGRGFHYKSVPHITLKSIAQNVALDPIFARHEPILDAALKQANVELAAALKKDPTLKSRMALKLERKQRDEGKRAITDADRRRWLMPPDNREKGAKSTVDITAAQWYHWEVPFDTDPDWPKPLADAVTAYRAAWRAKMDDVNACIAASAEQEELVDQPEIIRGITRVTGPFTVEAVQPPEMTQGDNIDRYTAGAGDGEFGGAPYSLPDGFAPRTLRVVESKNDLEVANITAYLDQMLRFIRADGVRFLNNRQMKWSRLESLFESGTANPFHAEGRWVPTDDAKGDADPEGRANIAVAFGPQYGPVTGPVVVELLRQAHIRGYEHVVIAGFNFDGAAQTAFDNQAHPKVKIHLAHIRPDINPGMNGLLKETPKAGSGQLFTVFGQPRIGVRPSDQEDGMFVVDMEGVDIYDPVRDEIRSTGAGKVAAWFLDSDYDGRTFCVTQAFFPDRSAWEKLAKALNGKDGPIDAERFEALSGTTSLPFSPGANRCVAVKVIDPRGNEVMAVEKV